jgi:hypothetical protein
VTPSAPTTYTFTVALKRADYITSNERSKWGAVRVTKDLRNAGAAQFELGHLPHMERAHIQVFVSWPDRRRRDVANVWPTLKAYSDGLISGPAGAKNFVGLLPDDDDRHLLGPHPFPTYHLSGMPGITLFRFDIVPLEGL